MLLAEFDAVGLGVEDILIAASSCDMSDILSVETVVMCCRAELSNRYSLLRKDTVGARLFFSEALLWSINRCYE